MPSKIKNKIKQYNNAIQKASKLATELDAMIEEYNVPIDNLIAMATNGDNPQTEALAYIHNGECTTESSLNEAIAEIEEVFLFYVNERSADTDE